MSFRFIKTILLSSFLLSCGLKISTKEAADAQQQSPISGVQVGCLQEGGKTMSNFFSGKETPEKVTALMNCMASSLKLFLERSRGASVGIYTADELQNFFELYFVGRGGISDDLMLEMMELKRVLLGGTVDKISRSEIERMLKIIDVFKDQALKILPFLPYSTDNLPKGTEEKLDQGIGALIVAGQELGKVLEATKVTYSFTRFEKLLIALEKAFQSSETSKEIRKQLPVIKALRHILLGSRVREDFPDTLESDQWRNFFGVSARWYGIVLKAEHFKLHGIDSRYGPGLTSLNQILNSAIELMNFSIDSHSPNIILFDEFDNLFDSFGKTTFLIEGVGEIQISTLKGVFKSFVKHMIGGHEPGPKGKDALGLSIEALIRLKECINRFIEGQRFLETKFREAALKKDIKDENIIFNGEGFTAGELLGDIGRQPPKINSYGTPLRENVEVELTRTILRMPPLFRGSDPQIYFAGRSSSKVLSFRTLTLANGIRQAFWMMLPAYMDNPANIENKIIDRATANEFKKLIEDILQAGIDLNFVEPYGQESVFIKRFREANLFTFSADGDETINIDEGVELLLMMISANAFGDVLHKELSRYCNVPTPSKPYLRPDIPADCFFREMFKKGSPNGNPGDTQFRVDRLWDHLPQTLLWYRHSFDTGKLSAFEGAVEKALRSFSFDPTSTVIDGFMTNALAGLLQYVEAVFYRFDLNQDMILDHTEIKNAFPIFKVGITEATKTPDRPKGVTDESTLDLLFTYMVYHGAPPAKGKETSEMIWWKLTRWTVNIQTDRTRIVNIFATLALSFQAKKLDIDVDKIHQSPDGNPNVDVKPNLRRVK